MFNQLSKVSSNLKSERDRRAEIGEQSSKNLTYGYT